MRSSTNLDRYQEPCLDSPSSFFLSFSLVCLTACGGGGVNEMQSVMSDITTVLKDVKDADGAEAAKPKLEPLIAKLSELTKVAAKNPEEAAKSFDADTAKEYAEVTTAYTTEMTRILSDGVLNAKLGEVLASIGQ